MAQETFLETPPVSYYGGDISGLAFPHISTLRNHARSRNKFGMGSVVVVGVGRLPMSKEILSILDLQGLEIDI
jgi:hypothetical protein